MLTRRAAIALLPASVMSGVSIPKFALAQLVPPPVRPDPNAASDILAELGQYNSEQFVAYYTPADRMIKLLGLLAGRRDVFANQNPLGLFDEINLTTDNILTSERANERLLKDAQKKTAGRISDGDKFNLMADIKARHGRISEILRRYYASRGFATNVEMLVPDQDNLKQLADEILVRGIALSNWRPDAFYAAARGYVQFQFVTTVLKDLINHQRNDPREPSLSNAATVRAYALRNVAEANRFFSIQLATMGQPPISSTGDANNPGPTRPATDREYEGWFRAQREYINRIPKDVFYGGEFAPDSCPPGEVRNFYGSFRSTSNFDQGFEIDRQKELWECGRLNQKGFGAFNDQIEGLGAFAPRRGNRTELANVQDESVKAINRIIKDLKEDREAKTSNSTPRNQRRADRVDRQQTRNNDQRQAERRAERLKEFTVLERMSWGLREIMART